MSTLPAEMLLESLLDMAWIKDTQLRYIAINEKFINQCQKTRESILNKADADIWPIELAMFLSRKDQEVLESGQSICQTINPEWRQIEQPPFQYLISPIKDCTGNIVALLGIAKTIREWAPQNAQYLAHMLCKMPFLENHFNKHALSQSEEIDSETLIQALSHELRRPLNGIITTSNMCIEGILGSLNTEQIEYLTLNYESGLEILAQINDLVTLLHRLVLLKQEKKIK